MNPLGRSAQSGLNQYGALHVYVGLQYGSAKASYPFENCRQITFPIQHKKDGGPRLDERCYFVDEVLVDSRFLIIRLQSQ